MNNFLWFCVVIGFENLYSKLEIMKKRIKISDLLWAGCVDVASDFIKSNLNTKIKLLPNLTRVINIISEVNPSF